MPLQFVLSILFLIFLPAHSLAQSDSNIFELSSIVISGEIKNPTASIISLNFTDNIRFSKTYISAVDKISGAFQLEFDLYHAQDVILEYNQERILLFADPGDSINLKIDTGKPTQKEGYLSNITFAGSNAETNRAMLSYQLYKMNNFFPHEFGVTSEEFLDTLEIVIRDKLSELNSFIQLYHPNKKFVTWAESNIRYGIANLLVHYKMYHPDDLIIFQNQLFPVDDISKFCSSSFAIHLQHFALFQNYDQDPELKAMILADDYENGSERLINNMLDKYQPSIIRDLMLFKMLSMYIDYAPLAVEKVLDERNFIEK